MERLTNTGTNGEIWITDNDETRKIGRKEAAYKKLKAYEDAEEQGRLIKLPCEVGDDVWFVPSQTCYKLNILNGHGEANKVYHQKVARITFDENGWYMVCDKDLEYAIVNTLIGKMFNETWFLTQSEAEAKLKELRGGESDSMEP
jgi:hypothetical protein